MPGFTATDEGKFAEELLAGAEAANGGKPLEFADDEPVNTDAQAATADAGNTAGVEAPKEGETAAQQEQVVDYMSQAIERARSELKHKTELSDKEINDHIAKRFLTAGKKIQREKETLKALEQSLDLPEVAHLAPAERAKELIRYFREMESHDIVKGLRSGKKFREVTAEDEGMELTDDQRIAQAVNARVNEILTPFQRQQQLNEQKGKQEAYANSVKEATVLIEAEQKALSDKYPIFKTWVDEAKASKGENVSPELDEILDEARKLCDQGMSKNALTYAVKSYFADHGLPVLVKQAKDETIARLQKKAGQRSESGTVATSIPKETRYHDEGEVAELLSRGVG